MFDIETNIGLKLCFPCPNKFHGQCELTSSAQKIWFIVFLPDFIYTQDEALLREALIKMTQRKVDKWPELIRQAVFADNITVRRATGFSPYYLLYGHHPLLSFDLREMTYMMEGYHSGMAASDLLALHIQHLQRRSEDIERATEALRKSRLASKEQFKKRFAYKLQKESYQAGDLVIVQNSIIAKELNRTHIKSLNSSTLKIPI